MLPRGYVGLVVADTRRAMEWEDGLRRAGFSVIRVETRGSEAAKGDWQIAVEAADAREARGFVSAVLRGDQPLPSRAVLPRKARIALVAIAITMAVTFLASWLATR